MRRGDSRGSFQIFLRSGVAGVLLAGAFLGAIATHNHSILSPENGLPGPDREQFLTRHDPLSRASHLHAVIAIEHEDDCVACHVQRVSGALRQNDGLGNAVPARPAVEPPPLARITAPLSPSGSRAPPALL
ncbi:MAG TPA: hypothetical protein VF376_09130 [Thermoanaerobaculia bacterium]